MKHTEEILTEINNVIKNEPLTEGEKFKLLMELLLDIRELLDTIDSRLCNME